MSFLENLILVFGIMTLHFTSSVQLRAFCIFLNNHFENVYIFARGWEKYAN